MYLARESPRAVVLHRGSSGWARLSRWHTDTDTFEHGQWLAARVDARRGDVSPDGSLFVYFARTSGGAIGLSPRSQLPPRYVRHATTPQPPAPSSAATRRAIASDAVSPGDSIPPRCT